MSSGVYNSGYRSGYRGGYVSGYPGGSSPTPPAPTPPAGSVLWLKADAGVTLSGGNVATWADQSGHGNDATPNLGATLTVNASSVNGLPGITFDGVQSVLDGTFSLAAAPGFSVAYVCKTGASTHSYSAILTSAGPGVPGTPGILWTFSVGNAGDGFGAGWVGPTGNLGLGSTSGLATGQARYGEITYDKVTWTEHGVNTNTVADTSFPTGTFTYALGHDSLGGSVGSWFPGDLCEILVYPRCLDAGDKTTLRAYINSRYGIS